MRRLIVNADDFGLCPDVTDGILAAHRGGIVTATTCLVSFPGLEHAVLAGRSAPELDVGLHLNFTWGAPVCDRPLPRLAPGRRFRGKKGLALALVLGRVPEEEIRLEAEAQLARFTDAFGPPSHVDLHQHVHAAARVWRVVVDVMRAAGVPFLRFPAEPGVRGLAPRVLARAFSRRERPAPPPRCTDHFRGLALTGRLTSQALISLLETLPPGLTELMVHPGGPGTAADIPDRLTASRPGEQRALTAPTVRARLATLGIELTTFAAEAASRTDA